MDAHFRHMEVPVRGLDAAVRELQMSNYTSLTINVEDSRAISRVDIDYTTALLKA